MRIAVVFHVPSPGGLTRFTHAIIQGLLAADRGVEVDYFVSDRLHEAGRVPDFDANGRARVIPINDPAVVDSNLDERHRLLQWVNLRLSAHQRLHATARSLYLAAWPLVARLRAGRVVKRWYQFAFTPELLERFASYDVVYLPFPYYIEPAPISAPVVGTFHDVNHKHFPENFVPGLAQQIDRQLQYWTRRADGVVVSTRFIEEDLVRHYPAAADRCSIVYVPPYNVTPLSESAREAALARFGLRDRGFLLYPSNQALHKNLLGLVQAADVMKRQAGRLDHPIVFTGFGTDKLGMGQARFLAEADRFLATSALTVGEDVRGLGFITDEEVDSLTRSARMVVSTSLYEAGCGPALDAWQFGVPVAFSNIPPFVEQLDALGVQAWVFDPRDPEDIAAVIGAALADRDEALAMAERSRDAIASHTWSRAGTEYLRIFERAIEHHRRPEAAGSAPILPA
jgi:glycosyltransferase involved in cell wall biosynthesis